MREIPDIWLDHPQRKVLMALIDSRGLNSKEMATACLISHRSARRLIEKFLLAGLIKRIGSGARAHYVVTLHGRRQLRRMQKRVAEGTVTDA